MKPTDLSQTELLLRDLMAQRILILDGAMGTMIQQYKLSRPALCRLQRARQGAVRQGQQ